MKTVTTTTGLTARQRRRLKAQADLETQHALWTRRIQDIMVADACDAKAAYSKLDKEVQADITSRPQWKQTVQLAWASFNRRILNAA